MDFMKQIIFVATIFGAMLATQLASAQGRDIRERQYNQKERIYHGKQNGSLTKSEAMRLKMQQAKIRNYKQMAKVDGRVSRPEQKLIRHEQGKANRNIYMARHNNNNKYGQKHGNGKRHAYGRKAKQAKQDWRYNYQSWDRGNGLSGDNRWR
jgi:hypothetical protein